MKTTLDLPDDLMRAVKIRAVEENQRLKQTIADLLRRGLNQERGVPAAVRRRVELPLIDCAHEARPGEEMTPERVLDEVLETGVPQEVVRKGRTLLITPAEPKRRRLGDLPRRQILNCTFDDLVATTWEWEPGS